MLGWCVLIPFEVKNRFTQTQPHYTYNIPIGAGPECPGGMVIVTADPEQETLDTKESGQIGEETIRRESHTDDKREKVGEATESEAD